MDETESQQRMWSRDFILICLSNLFVFLGFQMLMPTLPLYLHTLGGSNFFLGLVVGGFTFSALLIRPWTGNALERFGRKVLLLIGLAFFALSVGGMAVLTSLTLLFLVRLVQGFGFGIATTAAGTLATDLIPPKRRGEGMGYYGLSLNLAMAVGPVVGLMVVQRSGFVFLFLGAAVLVLVSFWMVMTIRYRPAPAKVSPPAGHAGDLRPLAQPASGWDRWVERTALRPSILMGLICVTFGGISSFLPLYAQQEGIGQVQWYFFLYAVCMMIVRPFTGRLYDQRGLGAIFFPGSLAMLAAMLLLTQMNSLWHLLVAAVLNGAGYGSIQPALQAWSVQDAPVNRKGMANATFFTFLDLGIGIGAVLSGALSHWIGYSGIYYLAACAILAAMLLCVPFTRTSGPQL